MVYTPYCGSRRESEDPRLNCAPDCGVNIRANLIISQAGKEATMRK